MIRVLKTDFFRLFRTKAFYAYPIFLVIILTLELTLMGIMTEKENVTDNDNGVTVEYYSADENTDVQEDAAGAYTNFGIMDAFSSLSDGLLMLFLGITVVMFATSETRSGFNKNAAGCLNDRACMPLS